MPPQIFQEVETGLLSFEVDVAEYEVEVFVLGFLQSFVRGQRGLYSPTLADEYLAKQFARGAIVIDYQNSVHSAGPFSRL